MQNFEFRKSDHHRPSDRDINDGNKDRKTLRWAGGEPVWGGGGGPHSPLSGSGNNAWGGGTEIAQMPGSNLAARHYIYDVRLPNRGKQFNNLRAKAQRGDKTDTNISI